MQRLGSATAICVLHAIVLGSPQEPTRKARTADVLAGTWVPDPARYEEYWNPKDTNGLQRLAPQPARKIPLLTIVVRREGITVDTIVDGAVISSHRYSAHEDYSAQEKAESVTLADGVVLRTDSHWTAQGLVNRWATVRDGVLQVRGSELWAPSEDGNELTITSVREGLGSKSKTIAVYRRRMSE